MPLEPVELFVLLCHVACIPCWRTRRQRRACWLDRRRGAPEPWTLDGLSRLRVGRCPGALIACLTTSSG